MIMTDHEGETCMKPRIALVYLGRRGGGPVYSLEMAKALKDYAELLCVVSKQSENLEQWRKERFAMLEVDTYTNSVSFVISTLQFWHFNAIAKQIKRFKPHVVYYPMLHYWTPILNTFLKEVPKIVTIHDLRAHRGEESKLFEWMTNMSVRQADRIVILSDVFRKDLEAMGVDSSKILVIPHGEFSYYSRIGDSAEICKDGKTILFFGRIHEYKGVSVLLQAFSKIKKAVPDARLLLVGSGDIRPYAELLSELKDVEIINMWVPDSEVAQYFLKADFVVVPYIDASQSGVIPLAYSFGLPVVASSVGGIPEQVVDGKTGFLVKPGDPDGLAEKCIFLLNNDGDRLRMGLSAFEKCSTELSWRNAAEKLVEAVKLGISNQNE